MLGLSDAPLQLHLAVAALGLVTTSELPEIAGQALLEGATSATLAALAGSTDRELSASDLARLFAQGLREEGISLPAPLDAFALVVNYVARQILEGGVSPHRGAEIICMADDRSGRSALERRQDPPGLFQLRGLYACYRYDDPGDPKILDRLITKACIEISKAAT